MVGTALAAARREELPLFSELSAMPAVGTRP